MSYLDLWYCAGIAVLGASFSYIVVSAVRFMGTQEQKPPTPANEGDAPPATFLRHAMVAFVGIMIGAQLLHHHQDQQEISRKDARKDMALVGAANASAPSSGGMPAVGGASGAALGTRPTQRPPRGFFSVEEAEKARMEAATPSTKVPAKNNSAAAQDKPAAAP